MRGDNYFAVWDGYWDAANRGDDADPVAIMSVDMDSSRFGFSCGDEDHEYTKISDFVYRGV